MPEGGGDPVAEILIVDDEPDIRFVLKIAFEAAGHRISEAHHGVAALDRVKDSRPDLVVTDVMMPVLDGLELIERLRSDPETAAIPILVLSSHAKSVTGADAAMAKPVRPHEVLATGLALIGSGA
jgi:CheY-like chemotaxis protein